MTRRHQAIEQILDLLELSLCKLNTETLVAGHRYVDAASNLYRGDPDLHEEIENAEGFLTLELTVRAARGDTAAILYLKEATS